ncbi:MAG: T9SS type A sorting domain-containing protein, partial [Crocinitomicaceae bacterium]
QNFTPIIASDDCAYPEEVIATDFDSDGDLDIAYSSFIDRRIGWLENTTIDCQRTYSYQMDSICPGDDIVFNGTAYSNEGWYADTLTNIEGCDSIASFELFHYQTQQLTISAVDFDLSAPSGLFNYQWFLNGVALAGETTDNIDALNYGNGLYSLEAVTSDGCLVISSDYSVTTISVDELNLNEYYVYPNPAENIVHLKLNNDDFFERAILTSIAGKVIKSVSYDEMLNGLDVSSFPKGIYFVNIETGKNKYTLSFVKR